MQSDMGFFKLPTVTNTNLLCQVSHTLPHLSLLFFSTVAGVLVLVNLLAKSGDMVSQFVQISLDLLHMVFPGLVLCS